MQVKSSATAEACANIAFIKYWGNRPEGNNLPLNPSISMTLASCTSRTTVVLLPGAEADEFILNGKAGAQRALQRVSGLLDAIRGLVGSDTRARVQSENTFPSGCGIASSASGFAALALAGAAAYGLDADPRELSRLARLGSGSAARSVPAGFVELHPGTTHEDAVAEQIAPETAWPELRDMIVIVSQAEKPTPSADGHRVAHTSEMLAARLAAVPERARRVRQAIRDRDLTALGEAAEQDMLSMHAVMLTSKPPLIYWAPSTLDVIQAVWELRRRGTEAYVTLDAGPNAHVLLLQEDVPAVEQAIRTRFRCRIIVDRAGPGAQLVERSAGD